jgi:hypothetical protein
VFSTQTQKTHKDERHLRFALGALAGGSTDVGIFPMNRVFR